MSNRSMRQLIDFVISMGVYIALHSAGAGFWALIIFPYGLWCFYDGLTRHEL